MYLQSFESLTLGAEWEARLGGAHEAPRDARAERYSQRRQMRSLHATAPAPGQLASVQGSDSESSASSESDSDGNEKSHSFQAGRAAAGNGAGARLSEGGRPSSEHAWRRQRGQSQSFKGSDHRPEPGERLYSLRRRNAALSYATHDDSEEEESSEQRQQGGSNDFAGKRKYGEAEARYQLGSNGSASSEETDVDALADVEAVRSCYKFLWLHLCSSTAWSVKAHLYAARRACLLLAGSRFDEACEGAYGKWQFI